MASPEDIQSFQRLQNTDAVNAQIIPKIPDIPDDVKKRFPSLHDWQKDLEKWRQETNIALRGGPQ